ncbi:Tetratricopeptide repeat (TPR)-like superfamily protein isoform 3 [Theobroma cacao]|uniref:Tetratricopeptide repeat (TPR)-like superfamily protein isoform 3 n=1 Tax=Theobroma cacao TaxID=3641 RepID=A0A061EN33_THECC|nr:Tetratricopeptide repeat (TPR)-like superfamily protein isoform 3 [Theobroma cacao]
MAEAEVGSGKGGPAGGNGGEEEISLKDKGNEFFKAGNYLKAAALYTQAIKQDPSNPTLYSNRAAAFLNLVKLNKALTDAETTITLNPQWEKGYFRKGCILEAMERYDDALAAFQIALQYNPQSAEVSRKIKRLSQLAKDKKRAQEVQNLRSNVDMAKSLETLKSEMQGSRKWRHGQHDGFFVQFESPLLRKLWFISSANEMGQTLCRAPDVLDIGAHELLPRLFKEKLSNSS